MKMFTRGVWPLVIAALLAAPAFAQDEKPADPAKPAARQPAAKKPGEPRQRGARQAGAAVNRFFQLPAAIKLTEAQQEQIAALKKEFAPKARELQQKQNAILTEDQKQARRKVMQELRDSEKKGKERQQAIQAALKLTPEQKQQQTELQAAEKELRSQIEPKLHALLSAEQKAQLPKRGRGAAARNTPAKPKKSDKPKQPQPTGSET